MLRRHATGGAEAGSRARGGARRGRQEDEEGDCARSQHPPEHSQSLEVAPTLDRLRPFRACQFVDGDAVSAWKLDFVPVAVGEAESRADRAACGFDLLDGALE